MGLREEVRGCVPIAGEFFRKDWLQHIAELAAYEVENDCWDSSERIQQYTGWQFQQFAACLPSHLNRVEFQTRLECLLPLEPDALAMAQRLFAPFGYQGTVTVHQYNLVVRRQIELTALVAQAPSLLSLYALCCTDSQFPKSGEPVQKLKTYLLSRGLSSRGWRMVLAMNPKCLNFIREFYQGSVREAAIDYLRICEALGVEGHHPRWLLASMLSMFGNSARPKRSYFKSMIADHFIENAAHVMRLYLNGALPVQPKESVQVVDVMRWLARDNATQFTRIQRQKGWSLLVKKSRDWQALLEVSASKRLMHWETPFNSIEIDGYKLVGLSDTIQLFEESKAMHNCVDGYSYALRCIDGHSFLASLRLAGKRAATVEFTRATSGGWALKAALGPCNKPLPQLLIRKLEGLATCIGELNSAKTEKQVEPANDQLVELRVAEKQPFSGCVLTATQHSVGNDSGTIRPEFRLALERAKAISRQPETYAESVARMKRLYESPRHN